MLKSQLTSAFYLVAYSLSHYSKLIIIIIKLAINFALQIEALYQEWRALKKLKDRKTTAEKKKRSAFVDNWIIFLIYHMLMR